MDSRAPAVIRPHLGEARSPVIACALGVSVMLLVGALCSGTAHAYEDRASIDLGAGLGLIIPETDLSDTGVNLEFGASFGINDMWTARALVGYGLHPDSALPAHVVRAHAELIYLVDIVQLVPFFGAGIGGMMVIADGDTSIDPALHLVAGLDYLINRKWAIGVDVRPIWLPLSFDSGVEPLYLTASLRVSALLDFR